jgi:multisubunit Na+/H+ antiporter MnhG subunit
MTNTATSVGAVGTVNALGVVLLQSTTTSTPSMTLAVPLISAVIGGVMSYAVLKTTVSKMERDVRDMRQDMSEMYSLLRESLTKIAHMEGRLDQRP